MPFLDWVNKNEAIKAAKNVPYHLIKKQKKYGEDTENLLIQGDNLLALKALKPYFANKIRCVFIDPPYNTQSAFTHYDDKLEHSQWLTMMYSRISLIRDLMATDGSLWISIDDDEAHYLKVMCDEIFGRENFVSNVIWQKKYSPQNDAKWLSDNHDHILVYAKNKNIWRPNLMPRSDEATARYKNLDKDHRGPWKAGDVSVKTYNPNTDYPITTPSGRIVNPPSGYCWRYSKEKLEELIKENRIWFGESGNNVPAIKRFLKDVKDGVTSMTIWTYDEVGHNQEAKKEVKVFNEGDVFDTPKPEKLMQKILTLASNEGDFVLDSFLGSGTTAAVAHKMNRKYIGIEFGGHAKTHCIPRLVQVIKGERGGVSQSTGWTEGGGFNFCTLSSPAFLETGLINPEISFEDLASFIWHFETKLPSTGDLKTPLLGIHEGTAYYLLYNGILGDRNPSGGNVLTKDFLKDINKIYPHAGSKVIYGETTRLGPSRLDAENITFKQIPYDINVI
jgi:adenine-specific DNA-methyltransferase